MQPMKPIPGKADITIKINEIPDAVRNGQGNMDFQVDIGEGRIVNITIKGKSYRKFLTQTEEFPMWVGAIAGKIGPSTKRGFKLLEAGLQIFEKKPKEPKPEGSGSAAPSTGKEESAAPKEGPA